MLNKLSFKEFLALVDKTYDNHAFELRYGQTIMNVLSKVKPDKYQELMQVNYDCFYDDSLVKITLEKLEKEWI